MHQEFARDKPSGFINRIEKVAVVGAGGNIGKYIVEHLLTTGRHVITAITRNGSTSVLPDGVKTAYVDYNDESSLVAALRDQQALIITMSVTAPPETHSKLVRAAAKAGVPYVFPNWWGNDITNDTLAGETFLGAAGKAHCAEIESLGVSKWILLCCNFWYETSLSGGSIPDGFDFKKNSVVSVVFFDEGTTPINTSTMPQYGPAVAALLSLKEVPDDENDTSPTISQFRNGAVRISSFLVTKEPSNKRYQDGMEEMNTGKHSGFVKLLYARVFYPNGGGDYQSTKGLHNELLGLPKEDIDEYTKIAVNMVKSGAAHNVDA